MERGSLDCRILPVAGAWDPPSAPYLMGPVHVDLNVTNACNLACDHCHASSGPRLPDELETEELKATIDGLHRIGTMSLAVAGGEPFTRPDIVELLEHACGLPGWQISVITNGLFFDRGDTLGRLVEGCPDLAVNVSLDGSTPEGMSHLRKQVDAKRRDPGKLFGKVVEGIEIVVDSGLENSVNFTLTRPTLDDARATYRLVTDELGAGGMVAIKFFPGGYGKDRREQFEIPYSRWSRFFAELTREKLDGAFPAMQISVPAPWEFYLPLAEAGLDLRLAEEAWGYRSPLRERAYGKSRTCGDAGGVAELAVDATGKVYPSVLYAGVSEMAAGDVRRTPLEDIWREASMLVRLRALGVKHLAGGCAGCPAVELCGGGSRARAYALSGSVTGADELCPLVDRSEAAGEPPPSPRPRREGQGLRESRTLGTGPSAMRLLLGEEGCELRWRGTVVRGDGALSELLEQLVPRGGGDGPDGPVRLEDELRQQGRTTLTELSELGIPLRSWPVELRRALSLPVGATLGADP